jgi:hypothetical protein
MARLALAAAQAEWSRAASGREALCLDHARRSMHAGLPDLGLPDWASSAEECVSWSR